ncbi:MAG: SDR family oxidoreductase [Saprospiraceae bacterium]
MSSGKKNILVTGGAGFIGSNLVDTLLSDDRIGHVRVLDNLSTGFLHNIEQHFSNSKFEFIEGDIRDYHICLKACDQMDMVSHQAALGSVPRSVKDPLTTNEVNITGMLHVLTAAKESKVGRFIYAASSSTYGDSEALPKKEELIGSPLSPYAVSKYVNELYASVYHRCYGMEVIGLRYFNVFGPRQSPTGAYAAAIPLFIRHLLDGTSPTINGDGFHSRDFTFVANAVQANQLALFTKNKSAIGEVFNVAYGEQTSLLTLFETIRNIIGIKIDPVFGPERAGDIKHSHANINKAKHMLGYTPSINLETGLQQTIDWHRVENEVGQLNKT